MRPGRVQRFFTAVLSVITAGCIPKQRRYNVPFSFENPGETVYCFLLLIFYHKTLFKTVGEMKIITKCNECGERTPRNGRDLIEMKNIYLIIGN